MSGVERQEDVQRLREQVAELRGQLQRAPPMQPQTADQGRVLEYLWNLDCGVIVIAPDTTITFANPKAQQLIDELAVTAIGRRVDDPSWSFIDALGNHIPFAEHPAAKVLKTGKAISGVTLGMLREGHDGILWMLSSATPIADAGGEISEILVSFSDVTLQKEAELALRESDERYQAIFNQAAVGIARVGMDGRWLEVNRKLCEIVGYERDELLQLSFQDITHVDDVEADMELMQDVQAGRRETYTMEKRYVRKSGHPIWANLTVSLTRDEQGEPKFFVSILEDISERKALNEALRESATHDALTGLNNREMLDTTLRLELERAARYDRPFSVLLLDFDHFKAINDNHGHLAGDEVLRHQADVFERAMRKSDTAGRYGGEEFQIILPELAHADAIATAERIRSAVANEEITFEDVILRVTVSIGIASFPEHGNTADELIDAADRAMYRAKQRGRNQVVSANDLEPGES